MLRCQMLSSRQLDRMRMTRGLEVKCILWDWCKGRKLRLGLVSLYDHVRVEETRIESSLRCRA